MQTGLKVLPSIGAFVLAGGLQVSGVRIPWLGYALMVLGVVLLIIPFLPLLNRVRVYEQRQSTGWWRDKLGSARIIWASYLIGGSTQNAELLKSGNFKRLILLSPDNQAVKAIKEMESDKSVEELQKNIRDLTGFAQKRNCDVRWCHDITYSLITIGNPPELGGTPPKDMWVFVEVYVPGIEAEKRPSFFLEWSKNQKLADKMLISFNKLWDHSRPASK